MKDKISVPVSHLDLPEATTNGIRITVKSEFSPSNSSPPFYYFFHYHITITNLGDKAVQLLSRRWIIEDALGNAQVVEGPGVVGEKPFILPEETYRYSSACPLPTAFGKMSGFYHMVDSEGEAFNVIIPAFDLFIPDTTVN